MWQSQELCCAGVTEAQAPITVQLPHNTTELIPGANPDFFASKIALKVSSPITPEKAYTVRLHPPFELSRSSDGQSSLVLKYASLSALVVTLHGSWTVVSLVARP